MSAWSTGSITLSIAVIAIYCVFSIPLFPDARKFNNCSRIIGTFLYVLSSILLGYETRIHTKIKLLFRKIKLSILKFNKERLKINCITSEQIQLVENNIPLEFDHAILAYFFFGGYCVCQLWVISNQFYFAFAVPECYSTLKLIANLTKILLGFLLLSAITLKIKNVVPNVNPKASYYIWGFLGAVCFSSAFKYVVEEVTWGYIDIVHKSIIDPDYGLNITNGSTVEEYVEKIFKNQAKCLEYSIFWEFAEEILELIPFSTEFFSLATFFCAVSWNNLGENRVETHFDSHNAISTPDKHICTQNCLFSIHKWTAYAISLMILLPTCISIWYFRKSMSSHKYNTGVWIFISQQVIFQIILLCCELTFYIKCVQKMDFLLKPPQHFQLDSILLIFPLFPLGILFTLRIFPDIAQFLDFNADKNYLTNSETAWAVLNIMLALLNYFQVTFQAIFISEIFCRIQFGSLKKTSYFFFVLATINFCIWFSWTLECKLVTIHGRTFKIFGVVEWIIIVYSTVPFGLFCFAHSTTCFWEIKHLCLKYDERNYADSDSNPNENPLVPVNS